MGEGSVGLGMVKRYCLDRSLGGNCRPIRPSNELPSLQIIFFVFLCFSMSDSAFLLAPMIASFAPGHLFRLPSNSLRTCGESTPAISKLQKRGCHSQYIQPCNPYPRYSFIPVPAASFSQPIHRPCCTIRGEVPCVPATCLIQA